MEQQKRPLKTLERVISKAGLGSRTEARRWIHQRRVSVNGLVVENPDTWVDMERDRVLFDGAPLELTEANVDRVAAVYFTQHLLEDAPAGSPRGAAGRLSPQAVDHTVS